MLSISLFVELLRTRPLTLFWAMAALQAVLWTLVPALFYSAPPGQLPVVLAIGHEFQLGTEFGPPLAFWLAEIAYRGAGMFGVYLLSQLCIVVAYWAVLSLGRAIVGLTHAVMAVLLNIVFNIVGRSPGDEAPIFASDGTAIKQRVVQFDIDMSLCCYCQLCVYPCPTVCILMTPEFEFAETSKENFLYRFAKEKPLQPAGKKEHEPATAGA